MHTKQWTVAVGTAALLNTFKPMQSQIQIMVFVFENAALGVVLAVLLTYQFFVKQQKLNKVLKAT